MISHLSIERRKTDVITNYHMKRLANEGWALTGFSEGENGDTWIAHFVMREDAEKTQTVGIENLDSLIALGRSLRKNFGEQKR